MDSRFHLKATFEVYGQTFEWDCCLNWSATDGEIDRRITEFFLESYERAYGKWLTQQNERDQKLREDATQKVELAELKRLTQKYPQALSEEKK